MQRHTNLVSVTTKGINLILVKGAPPEIINKCFDKLD